MSVEVERVDVRLDLALSLLETTRPAEKPPVMPAVWASAGLAAASLFLAGLIIFGAGSGRPAHAEGRVLRATEAPAAQPADTGNATFELSATRDGLKGNVSATHGAVAGSEGVR